MSRTTTPPKHGERRCYLRGCRRPECVAANKRYCKEYRVATVHESVRVDPAATIERLLAWTGQGYSLKQIEAVTRVSTGALSKILRGKQQRLHPHVAARILTSPPPKGAPWYAMTDSTGTVRRGRALHALGYPLYEIAAGLPMNVNDLARMLIDPPSAIRVSTAVSMTRLCRQKAAIPGPSKLARLSAARRNWHGLCAWEDIDNPTERPTEEPTEGSLSRNELAARRRAEIAHLTPFGVAEHDIAARLDMNQKTVHELIRDLRKAA